MIKFSVTKIPEKERLLFNNLPTGSYFVFRNGFFSVEEAIEHQQNILLKLTKDFAVAMPYNGVNPDGFCIKKESAGFGLNSYVFQVEIVEIKVREIV